MPSSLICEMVGTTLLAVQNSRNPDEGEWQQFLALIRERSPTGIVVWAPKEGPNSGQRRSGREALDALGARAPNVAVITPSAVARGIVALVNGFGGRDQIRAFSPGDIGAALRHAKVDAAEHDGLLVSLERLKGVVGP